MLAPLRFLMHRTEPKPDDLERWQAKELKAREAEPVLAGHFAELDRQLQGRDYLCGAFSAADIAVFMPVFWTRRLGGPSLEGARCPGRLVCAAWRAAGFREGDCRDPCRRCGIVGAGRGAFRD